MIPNKLNGKNLGSTETRTRITGFKVLGAHHYTIEPTEPFASNSFKNFNILIIYFCRIVKKYSHSNTPSSGKSVQWIAFLTLSIPN